MKNRKVLMIGNSHLVIFGFRKELIEHLCQTYEVVISFPNSPFGDGKDTSERYGCRFIETPMKRHGINPLEELALLLRYIKIIKDEKPDICLTYTVKCDIYGGLACRMLNVPFMPNITGLGKGLTEGKLKKIIAIFLYRIAVKKSKCLFFQNSEDKRFFEKHRIRFEHDRILPGSGVNLKEYVPLPFPGEDKIRFTYIARVMRTKGIEQFIEAAEVIKKKYENTEFHICGYCEEDYKNTIAQYEERGMIIYHGLVAHVIDYIEESHCIVLPTFHPEGISNVLLEAAACARPIITTDRPGCREVVEDGWNGYLITERSTEDLIKSIEKFIGLGWEEKRSMGLLGRTKVEKEFDRKIVVEAYMQEIGKTVGVKQKEVSYAKGLINS